MRIRTLLLIVALFSISATAREDRVDPLPSWNDGPTKQAVLAFVEAVTTKGGPHYVPPAERIATFDNDGTLWCEQPMYTQLAFALDRIVELAPKHPEWKTTQPFKAVLENDQKALAAAGTAGLVKLVTATHSGMSTDEFRAIAQAWIAKARHPRFDRPYTELVYQPMLELLALLRAHGFQTWIVSGGGVDFMRPWTERVYGIPPEQVIGSAMAARFDGSNVVREPKVTWVNDKEDKPVAIARIIGRRPIAAFGNSDGDLAMLQYTAAQKRRTLALFVHHTDAEREYAYDRKSKVGQFDKGLDEAKKRKWAIADMKRDWKRVFR